MELTSDPRRLNGCCGLDGCDSPNLRCEVCSSYVATKRTPSLGFGGYQALIRAYISTGLRKHLAEREAQRAKDSTVEEFSQRLIAHGMPEQAIEQAVAEMRAAR